MCRAFKQKAPHSEACKIKYPLLRKVWVMNIVLFFYNSLKIDFFFENVKSARKPTGRCISLVNPEITLILRNP